jgi:hypothetical protein
MDPKQINKALQLIKEPKQCLSISNQNEVSVYSGKLTAEGLRTCSDRVARAFPRLTEGFYDEWARIIADEGIGDHRLADAVDHVIKTCQYPEPTIANFISFDRKIKLYSYDELCKMVHDTNDSQLMSRYKAVKFKGQEKAVWVLLHEYDNIKHLEG